MTVGVAAIVPVIDEAEAIGDIVSGLLQGGACCVMVVDGGSRDGTRELAAAAGAVVVEEPRRGYGRACLTGARHALTPRPDGHAHAVIAFLDGDGSCDPADLSALLAALAHADVALGLRPAALIEAGAMPWHARLGNLLVADVLRIRSSRSIHDLPPFKALRREAFERLDLADEGYGWTVQLVARALADPSIRTVEAPVAFRARRGGVSKVSGSWRTSIRAGRSMVAVALRETRARPVVALMAKAPGPGSAKTRLAVEIGDEHTADFWAACLADVAESVQEASRRDQCLPAVMVAHEADVEPVIEIIGPGWNPVVQRKVGLSAALGEVFLAAFDRGADRAVAVAGDAPGLAPRLIQEALNVLRGNVDSAVVGPSSDGGYHLIGLRWRAAPRWWPGWLRRRLRQRLARRLETGFGAVPMGGSSALHATTQNIAAAGWRLTLAAPWPDIDTLADLRRLAELLDGDSRWAARTASWIGRHRDLLRDPATLSESGRTERPR